MVGTQDWGIDGYVSSLKSLRFLPETKGRSLEDMDVIFGAVGADKRQADILKHEKGLFVQTPSTT